MSQTLYLKYRPQDFDSVIGQEIARIALKNAAKEEKLSQAYLFTGPRGTGKTSMARIVAKAINCVERKEDGNPCNKCSICASINEGRNVDMIEIDAASHTSVDDVRDLIDKARFMPNESKKKVYIIDEVHMLSKSAFNALLKTLEEPPEHVHFILATTEIYKVPETIISRCQKFDFKRIEIRDIVARLKYIAEKEEIECEGKALNLIAKVAEGGLRNAITVFQKVISNKQITYNNIANALDITGLHIIEGMYEDLEQKKLKDILIKLNDLYENGASLSQFTKDFIEFLREKLLENIAANNQEKTQELLLRIEMFEKAFQDLKNSTIPQLPLEIAVTRICLGEEEGRGNMELGIRNNEKENKEIKSSKAQVSSENTSPKLQASSEKSFKPQASSSKIQSLDDKKEEVKEKVQEPVSFSLVSLQEHWKNICDDVSFAFKQAYKNASPVDLQGNILTLAAGSNFYVEKISDPKAKLEMEQILKKMFGKDVVLETRLDKKEEKASEAVLNEESVGASKEDVSLSAEETAALFGGEIVQE